MNDHSTGHGKWFEDMSYDRIGAFGMITVMVQMQGVKRAVQIVWLSNALLVVVHDSTFFGDG
jgi:hypothetical protein